MTGSSRLTPSAGALYVVRWVRLDGRDVRHRYYRRHRDAHAFAAKLASVGREARIYRTNVTWQETAP